MVLPDYQSYLANIKKIKMTGPSTLLYCKLQLCCDSRSLSDSVKCIVMVQEVDAVAGDPARMAASIQALARSVHGNTSEIFGELPRPPTRVRNTSQRSGSRH